MLQSFRKQLVPAVLIYQPQIFLPLTDPLSSPARSFLFVLHSLSAHLKLIALLSSSACFQLSVLFVSVRSQLTVLLSFRTALVTVRIQRLLPPVCLPHSAIPQMHLAALIQAGRFQVVMRTNAGFFAFSHLKLLFVPLSTFFLPFRQILPDEQVLFSIRHSALFIFGNSRIITNFVRHFLQMFPNIICIPGCNFQNDLIIAHLSRRKKSNSFPEFCKK